MIVRAPRQYLHSRAQPGDVLDEWASLADIYPTILDIACAPTRDVPLHGQSIVPLLQGQQVPWRDTIFVEFNGVNSLATSIVTVRQGDWKYGWNCSNRDELYNLASDPHEMDNRIGDPGCADQVLHMRRLIETWMVETGYPGPALNMYRHSRIEPLTA